MRQLRSPEFFPVVDELFVGCVILQLGQDLDFASGTATFHELCCRHDPRAVGRNEFGCKGIDELKLASRLNENLQGHLHLEWERGPKGPLLNA